MITLARVEEALDHVKQTAGDVVPSLVVYADQNGEPHCAVGRVLAHLNVPLPTWRMFDPVDLSDDPNVQVVTKMALMTGLSIEEEALDLLAAVQDTNDDHVGKAALSEIIDEGREHYRDRNTTITVQPEGAA